jgi:hypothetical protein
MYIPMTTLLIPIPEVFGLLLHIGIHHYQGGCREIFPAYCAKILAFSKAMEGLQNSFFVERSLDASGRVLPRLS